MKVMWMQLSDPSLFQILHKSQSWPIRLALFSHLQPWLEFPGAEGDVGRTQHAARTHAGCVLEEDGALAAALQPRCFERMKKLTPHTAGSKDELTLFRIPPTSCNCLLLLKERCKPPPSSQPHQLLALTAPSRRLPTVQFRLTCPQVFAV